MTIDPNELLNGITDSHITFYHTSRDTLSDEIPEQRETQEAKVIPMERAKESGRKALYEGPCSIHGEGPNGESCAKFYHLPGNGRGILRPNLWRILRILATSSIKPLFLLGILWGGYTILTGGSGLGFGGHFLQFGNGISPATGPMPNVSRHAQNGSNASPSSVANGVPTVSPTSIKPVKK